MKIFSNKKAIQFREKVSVVLAFLLLAEAAYPTLTFALTSGPSAPEFSSFEPVTTTNMVNEFSGDFSYNIPVLNIPGPNGGGYAMSLSYHSGESVESEASWVGYGWTLNPGAINRGKRGYADDTKNSRTYYNDVPANWTVSTGTSIGNLEAFSFNLPISVNGSIRYNNYRGFGYTAGAGLSFRQGLVSLGYSVSDGSSSFSAQVNPAALLNTNKRRKNIEDKAQKYRDAKTPADKAAAKADYEKSVKKANRQDRAAGIAGSMASNYGMYALGDQQHPTTVTAYSGTSFNVNFNLQTNPTPVEVGGQFGFTGNFNLQKNEDSNKKTAYGYLYSAEAYADESAMMDYGVEKESMYNKRDRYLSIPFSNADAFSIAGEGLGGGFRLHSRMAGHFRPNRVSSKMDIVQASADISVGLMFGAGVNLGLGEQTLSVDGGGWGDAGYGNTLNFRFADKNNTDVEDMNEAFYFRFNGDMGGGIDFGNDDVIPVARITQQGWVQGAKTFYPRLYNKNYKIDSSSTSKIALSVTDSVKRNGRSSYIGYHTNAEMANSAYTYEKSASILTSGTVDRANAAPEQIAEIATVNEEGNRYVYGLPVNVSNETSMQYDVEGATAIKNNFLAIKNISNYKRRIGEVDNGTYTSGYLLTQITTPDYVDMLQDGPTPDDLGGYTKFEYERVYSATGGTPYHYRTPYTGLLYSKGELTDPTDDMGSYTSGNKDVYYLRRVVTKTHTATFYTSNRTDGKDAGDDYLAAGNESVKGTHALKQLDSIVLKTTVSPLKTIKKVVFKYDNSLCKNVPNGAINSGKLTLKALWFESEGIINAKVSPYQFSYSYPNIAGTYPARYNSRFKTGYDIAVLTDPVQNPDYSNFAIDAWGNYQDATTGADRYSKMQHGVNQNMTGAFDPAAWQLKVIKLPSGGEIHVQYEQDDYLYVQNRRATALVSLKSSTDPMDQKNDSSGVFSLNVADIGVTTDVEKQELVTLINQNLKDQKIYFKFLYALIGSMQTGNPLGACNSDYITGYVNFVNAVMDPVSKDVKITVGDGGTNSGYSLPRRICLDLVKKQKGGKLNQFGNCNAGDAGVQNGLTTKAMVMQLLNKIGTAFFSNATSCKEIKPSLSYFKIPVLKPKKGGGLRVKRLLMYDANGIDYGSTSPTDGAAALYGTEYFYQETDGKSSGVATNEPSTIREENALVSILAKRSEQGLLNKAIAGIDREQFEGPIGENLLPTPSVGYSRVVSKNIHSGKTNTGFLVSEFFTVKEYPFDMEYSAINNAKGVDQTNVQKESDWMNLPAIITNYAVSNIWSSQGYRFILNSMNGQPKSVSTYAGDFTNGVTGPLSSYSQSSSTSYEYFQPGEKVNVALTPDGPSKKANPGKETEMVFEMKQVEDITADASIEIDFGVGIAGIIPLPQASASPLVNYTESKMRTHVTSRVIQYPAIQKAVVSKQDGMSHRTENLVFSAYTGKPIKTKTTDGYDGLVLGASVNKQNGTYTSYSTPASSQYNGMGQKAINERYILRPGFNPIVNVAIKFNNIQNGGYNEKSLEFTASSGNVCNAMKLLSSGDLIRINEDYGAYFYIDRFEGSKIYLTESSFYAVGLQTTPVSSIEIVKSSKTNQLNAMAGQYTTYGKEQGASTVAADPARTAERNSFIAALNSALNAANGQSINMATYPYVVIDEGCTTPVGSITVYPAVNNTITIQTNASATNNLVKNGDFSAYNSDSFYTVPNNNHFFKHAVLDWTLSHGSPDYDRGNDDNGCARIAKRDGSNVEAGILQKIKFDPAKQYILTCKARAIDLSRSVLFQATTLSAYVSDSLTSGLPKPPDITNHYNLFPAPGLSLLNTGIYKYVGVPTGQNYTTFTSAPFSPGNANQLYLYAAVGSSNTYVEIDDVSITETGCTTTLYTNSTRGKGRFDYNESGQILYYSPDNDCYPQVVNCFRFCGPNASYKKVFKVVSASANTYKSNWSYNNGRGNPYESGEYGKWRVEESYVYNSPIQGGSKSTERNYDSAGVFAMKCFKWSDPGLNDATSWIRTNKVTKYSINGEVTEEVDALGVYSAAKYGYSGKVPYISAKNSSYDCLKFEGFENLYSNKYLEEYVEINPAKYIKSPTLAVPAAHSGVGSYELTPSSGFAFRPFYVDSKMADKVLSLKVWVKDTSRSPDPPLTVYLIATYPANSTGNLVHKVAQTGEWTLYEVFSGQLQLTATYYFQLYSAINTPIYIDDVRQQPVDAQANAFVYDPATLRLKTSFDDQHFGLFYRYNAEGKLVSKMIETEKGMKTITEQQYNTPLITRP